MIRPAPRQILSGPSGAPIWQVWTTLKTPLGWRDQSEVAAMQSVCSLLGSRATSYQRPT